MGVSSAGVRTSGRSCRNVPGRRETRLFAEFRLPIFFQVRDPPSALMLHAGRTATRLGRSDARPIPSVGPNGCGAPCADLQIDAAGTLVSVAAGPCSFSPTPGRGTSASSLMARVGRRTPPDAKSTCRPAMPSHPILEAAVMRHLCKGVVSPVRESVTTWWLAQTEFVVEYDRPTFRWDFFARLQYADVEEVGLEECKK